MHGNRWSPVNLGPQEAGLWQCGWVLGSCPWHPRPAEVSSLEGLSERRWGASATTLSPRERPWPEPLPEAQGGPLLPGDHVLTSGRPPPEGVANCLGGVAFPGFQGWGGRFGEAGGGLPLPPSPSPKEVSRCQRKSGGGLHLALPASSRGHAEPDRLPEGPVPCGSARPALTGGPSEAPSVPT